MYVATYICNGYPSQNYICLLNQMHASHRLARAWFLKIDPVQVVGMHACVCPCPRLLITSGVMWHDMDLI